MPLIECDKAKKEYKQSGAGNPEEEEDNSTFGIIITLSAIGLVICCCVVCICLSRERGYRNPSAPTTEEANKIHFTKNDWKYWDSILPEDKSKA